MTDTLRPATEQETAEWLAGHLAPAGAIETEHGLMLPAATRGGREVAYDPAFDLYRTNEATVRKALAVGTTLPGGLTIVAQGRYLPGGPGCYAGVAVLCHRDDAPFADTPYSTHVAYIPSEADGVRRPESQTGHYDLTLAQATRDLGAR